MRAQDFKWNWRYALTALYLGGYPYFGMALTHEIEYTTGRGIALVVGALAPIALGFTARDRLLRNFVAGLLGLAVGGVCALVLTELDIQRSANLSWTSPTHQYDFALPFFAMNFVTYTLGLAAGAQMRARRILISIALLLLGAAPPLVTGCLYWFMMGMVNA